MYNPSTYPVIFKSSSMTVTFDDQRRIAWSQWHVLPRPCVTHALLMDLQIVHQQIQDQRIAADYYITYSSHPEAFSLGGDLDLFRRCARENTWEPLTAYAQLCVDAIYSTNSGFNRGVTSIAIVNGPALGGGWETALSMDYTFAEEQASFGLPEILFNLFPGMGAYSILARKIGIQKATEFISSGTIYDAPAMLAVGLVEKVIPKGDGIRAVLEFIDARKKQLRGHRAFALARQLSTLQTSKQELTDIVMSWVSSAKKLTPRDLRMMDLLVHAQSRLGTDT